MTFCGLKGKAGILTRVKNSCFYLPGIEIQTQPKIEVKNLNRQFLKMGMSI